MSLVRPLVPIVLSALSLLLLLLVPSAAAATVQLVEGEHRDRDAGTCDGEEVRTETQTTGSNSTVTTYLYFPGDDCWAEWDVDLPRAAEGLWLVGGAEGCAVFGVLVDGALLGTTPELCDVHLEWVGLDLPVPTGAHTIQVVANLTSGGTAARLDRLQFREGPDAPGTGAQRIEAEDADRDAGECSDDGEAMHDHFEPQSHEAPSGGEVLWFPDDGCWAAWDVDLEQSFGRLVLVNELGWPNDPQCGHWKVFIDGELAGSTRRDCQMDGLQEAVLKLDPPLAAGTHTVLVEAHWSPSSANGALDYLEFGPEGEEGRTCVDGLVATAEAEGFVHVAWPPLAGAASYEVTVVTEEGQVGGAWAAVTTETEYRFQGQAERLYTVQVAALDASGDLVGLYCRAEVTAIPFAATLPAMVALVAGAPLAYAWSRRRSR